MDFINKINDWVINTLGSWISTYSGLIFAGAVIIAFILLVAVIIVGACNASKKKKLKKLTAGTEPTDEQKLRDEVRAEVEKEHASDTKTVEEARAAADASSRYNDELRGTIAERDKTIDELKEQNSVLQARIDELGSMLGQANSNAGQVNNDLYRRINELNQTNKELENENNLLKAENAQIKATALQQQLAANNARATEPASTGAEVDEDDEYDEYYDDYGDSNSLVKVTVKFDRVKNNWVVLRSDTDRTYRRLSTKQEALVIAKDLAKRLHAQLVVHKKDGKFQKI